MTTDTDRTFIKVCVTGLVALWRSPVKRWSTLVTTMRTEKRLDLTCQIAEALRYTPLLLYSKILLALDSRLTKNHTPYKAPKNVHHSSPFTRNFSCGFMSLALLPYFNFHVLSLV